MSFEIDISCPSDLDGVDPRGLKTAIMHALSEEQVAGAILSLSIVDNATIHRLNRQHLQHDYPTDVISFPLDWVSPHFSTPPVRKDQRSAGATIEGEIVVSWEYAAKMAPRCGWQTQDELTLYAIHGMLHICGYDDLSPAEKEVMRSRERCILGGMGLVPVYPGDSESDMEPPGASGGCTEPSGKGASEGLP